jgi:hypothetical protein
LFNVFMIRVFSGFWVLGCGLIACPVKDYSFLSPGSGSGIRISSSKGSFDPPLVPPRTEFISE